VESISKAEAARMLGVSRANINYLIEAGHLRTITGPNGYEQVILKSVKNRLETHGSKRPYLNNENVVELFQAYLNQQNLRSKVPLKRTDSGKTGPDFVLEIDGATYFIEVIGSNPSRGVQSNSFRSAFQSAISRIDDPSKQVPVILMAIREEMGMYDRAKAWGNWGWRKCFEHFELWFIDNEDKEIIVRKRHALDYAPIPL